MEQVINHLMMCVKYANISADITLTSQLPATEVSSYAPYDSRQNIKQTMVESR